MALILAGRLAANIQRIDGITTDRLSGPQCQEILARTYPGAAELRGITDSLTRGRALYSLRHRGLALADTPARRIDIVLHTKRSARRSDTAVFHHCSLPLPANSLHRVSLDVGLGEEVYVTSPALAWMLAAKRLSFAGTLLLAMEFCGSYATDDEADGLCAYHLPPATNPLALARDINALSQAAAGHRVAGLRRCQDALPFVLPDSASPMESRVAITLSLPLSRGGWGIGRLALNAHVDLTREQQLIAQLPYLSLDGLISGTKLGYEYDSKTFHENVQRDSVDRARLTAAQALGYRLLSITTEMAGDTRRFFAFCDEFARLTGKRIRPWSQRTYQRRLSLHRELGFPGTASPSRGGSEPLVPLEAYDL